MCFFIAIVGEVFHLIIHAVKTNIFLIKLAGAAVLVRGLNASAAGWVQNLYLNTDLGASFVNDVTIKGAGGNTATFDPGVCGNLCLGYHITPVLAAEFETGVIWNSFDKVGGVPLSVMLASADLYQIPFKLNLICNVPTKSSWTPYIGAGAGGMASILEGHVDQASSPTRATISVIGNGNFHDTDCTFAYQAIAGLKYNISAHAQIDLGYKFFGTFDHSWSDRGRDFNAEAIYTHAFLVSFTWRF